jgi:KDO2-lipid IV(A) lauroyltransferase
MLYYFYLIAFSLARVLPRGMCQFLATLLARLYLVFAKKSKTALGNNLKVVLGEKADEKEVERHIRLVFLNFGRYLADFLKFFRISRESIFNYVEVENSHNIDLCREKGKGVICVTAHLGNWELGGGVVAAMGYKMNAIVWEHPDKRINKFFMDQRVNNKINVIPLGMRLKECFRALRKNEVLAIVADKDYTGDTEKMSFFGKTADMPRGAAVLSVKTGAPILVCAVVRKPDNTFKLHFSDPIYPGEKDESGKAVRECMEQYLGVLEIYIKQNPDQWYTFYNVWK